MKTGLYLANSDNQLSGWTKKQLQITSQSQTCTKKMLWSLFGGLTHPSFLNPGESIVSEMCAPQMDEMHWKAQRLQSASANRRGPIPLHDNAWPHDSQGCKSWTNWATKFCLIHYIHLTSHQLTATFSSNFLQGKCFHNQQEAESAFQGFLQFLRHRFFHYRNNKTTYFSLANMCWLKWFLFWLIKICLSLIMI